MKKYLLFFLLAALQFFGKGASRSRQTQTVHDKIIKQ